MIHPILRGIAACFVALQLGAAALAQGPPAGETAPSGSPEMRSPRAVLQSFLARMASDEKRAAADLLDLSRFTDEVGAAKGPELAYKLFVVLRWASDWPAEAPWPPRGEAEFSLVPEDPDTPSPWAVSGFRESSLTESERIRIERGADGLWRFSTSTIAEIEPLFELAEVAEQKREWAAAEARINRGEPATTAEEDTPPSASPTFSIWFRNLFPPILRRQRFLLPDYQWICLLGIGIVGRLAERFTRWLLTLLADAVLQRYDTDFKDSTAGVWKPVGRLVNAAAWYYTSAAIGLPLSVVGLLLIVLRMVAVFSAVAAAFAITDLIASYLTRRARRTERRYDDLVIPLAATTIKVVACVAAVLAAAAAFDKQLPISLLGGLGLGGVALALASQETLSNFFGSLTVLFDRPFEVGDWVIVEGIEGEIESVGFRSTKIRTGLNSQVTLPNSKLAGAAIDNLGRRKYRRYLTRLGVEYGTDPERIEAFCEGIRELIRRHPHTRKDFYCVYFNDFGASALEILLVVYFEAPDWATELRERHRLLADIARLAKELRVAFAFPTQTLHLQRSDSAAPPGPPEDPDLVGQKLAAEIAGELPNYQDRPGRVKFTGPTPIDPPTA